MAMVNLVHGIEISGRLAPPSEGTYRAARRSRASAASEPEAHARIQAAQVCLDHRRVIPLETEIAVAELEHGLRGVGVVGTDDRLVAQLGTASAGIQIADQRPLGSDGDQRTSTDDAIPPACASLLARC